MSEKTIRVGIIGAGANTRLRHLPGFQELENVEVSVLCNRTEASARKVAEEFGVPRVETDWRTVIEDPEIDAICIGTWPYMHAEITLAALEAGKHVLTEARMACDYAEAEAMLQAAEEHPNLVAQIVPAPFSLRHDATIVRLLAELGELREVNVVHRCGMGAASDAPITWRQDHELSGKNTHTLGILYETAQRWLGSGIDPEWLVADAALYVPERPDGKGGMAAVTIPDVVSVMGRYTGGAKFSFEVSSLDSAQPVSEYRLVAEKGTLRFDFTAETLYLAPVGEEEVMVEPDPGTDRTWLVEADFIESIRSGAPVRLTSFEDGLRYMRFTDMVWESWNAGAVRQEWPLD